MAHIAPFKAYRPSADKVSQVTCPPYDVVSRETVSEIIKDNRYSFLRVTRPDGEIDNALPFDTESVYQKAKENLASFLNEGLLKPDADLSYYIYMQTSKSHHQTGLVCLTSVKAGL